MGAVAGYARRVAAAACELASVRASDGAGADGREQALMLSLAAAFGRLGLPPGSRMLDLEDFRAALPTGARTLRRALESAPTHWPSAGGTRALRGLCAAVWEHGSIDLGGPADTMAALYEPLLGAQQPSLRRRRGVYVTPRPLADCLVDQVDLVLERALGLADGLADLTTYAERGLAVPGGGAADAPIVRVLDPACGSGVFLLAVLRRIRARLTQARFVELVQGDLGHRLCGFDRVPAALAACEAVLSCELEAACLPSGVPACARLEDVDTLALDPAALPPFTVLLGNPPYARGAQTAGGGVDLTAPYKQGLRGERNLQPLSDLYLRFFAFGECVLQRSQLG